MDSSGWDFAPSALFAMLGFYIKLVQRHIVEECYAELKHKQILDNSICLTRTRGH